MNVKELIENLSNLMLIYLICPNKSESTQPMINIDLIAKDLLEAAPTSLKHLLPCFRSRFCSRFENQLSQER